jgi:choline-sulfatase
VGRILEALSEAGLARDTVTALTADHGELLGEHNYYFEHSTRLFQPVLHVPLVMAGPGLPAGVRVPNRVSLADVMPTLVELLGLSEPGLSEQFQGNVLLPLVRGAREAAPTARFAVCNYPEEWCVVFGRHKYSLLGGNSDSPGTLVDLEADPGEEVDLSAQAPAVAAQLRRLVMQAVRSAPGLMGAVPPPSPSEEHRRQLEALGYL